MGYNRRKNTMKTKIIMATLATLCLMAFNACNSSEMIIQKEVAGTKLQCPMEMGSGLKLVDIEYTGLYVTYYFKGDDSMYSFSKDLVTEAMKEQLVKELWSKAASDANVAKFMNALKEKHVGIIYHYFTDSSVMDVIIEPSKL